VSHERIRLPPSAFTGEQAAWLYDLTKAVNAIPTMSYFSGTNPGSSGVTGVRGQIAVNVGSTSSILYVKYGSAVNPDKTSWNTVA
jgi:hypothetical protein